MSNQEVKKSGSNYAQGVAIALIATLFAVAAAGFLKCAWEGFKVQYMRRHQTQEVTVATAFPYFERHTIGISAARDVEVNIKSNGLDSNGHIHRYSYVESIVDKMREEGVDMEKTPEAKLAGMIFETMKADFARCAAKDGFQTWLINVKVKSRDTEGVYHE